MKKTVTRKHIKMYSDDKFLQSVKDAAEELGISQSTYVLLAVKGKIKEVNK